VQRCLYINSLCVIQEGDGGQDWNRKAAMMDKVYTTPFCKISADWVDYTGCMFFEHDDTPSWDGSRCFTIYPG
jgi:hypothetical protein